MTHSLFTAVAAYTVHAQESVRAAAQAAAAEALAADPSNFDSTPKLENYAALVGAVLDPQPLAERSLSFAESARRKAIAEFAGPVLIQSRYPQQCQHALEWRARRDSSFGTAADGGEVIDVVRQVEGLLDTMQREKEARKDAAFFPPMSESAASALSEPRDTDLPFPPSDKDILAAAGEQ